MESRLVGSLREFSPETMLRMAGAPSFASGEGWRTQVPPASVPARDVTPAGTPVLLHFAQVFHAEPMSAKCSDRVTSSNGRSVERLS